MHHDVVVLADDGLAPGGARFALRDGGEDGLRVLRATLRPSRAPFAIAGEYVAAVLAAIRRLAAEGRRPDVLHAHVYHAGVAALLAGRRHRIPVVVSEHSSHFPSGTLSRSGRARARLVFGAADLVCPVSEFLRRSIEANGTRGRFRVVPNSVDTTIFTPRPPLAAADERARILVVSGLHPVKGVVTFLRAASRVAARRADFRVDVVGDGPERAACERVITEHGLGERVTLHGYRDAHEVAGWLARSSFLALPSRTETFGVAAVEAQAAGRPVLAARVGALPEIVADDAGLLVPTPDEGHLAAGLDAMLDRFPSFDGPELARRAATRFGREAVGAQWDDVYRSLAS